MACHSPVARTCMPVYAAGTYGILQTPGGQGVLFAPGLGQQLSFSWEVAQSPVSSANGERPSLTRVQRRRTGEVRTVRRDQAVPFLSRRRRALPWRLKGLGGEEGGRQLTPAAQGSSLAASSRGPPRALSIVPPMWRHKPLLVEHLMHEGDGNRALPHRRGHALDIAAPDVADREHTGQTRFEEVGRPRQRPTGGGQILRG